MRAIQKYLPAPMHYETMRIFVNVGPHEAWEKVRHFNVSLIPWVNFLFKLRTVTDIFSHNVPQFGDTHTGVIDEIGEHNKGFVILEEDPGKYVVIGAIGKFWHLSIPFKDISPQQFPHFDDKGWGKVAWSITVEPFMEGSTICFDLRTSATDDTSWKKFSRYYHFIGIFSRLIRHSLMNSLETDLGKMTIPGKQVRNLPGDQISNIAKHSQTNIVVIEAPVDIVWSYLMQLGCDRAGWYSIDLLDNGNRKSIDHLVEDWKDRKPGDKITASPSDDGGFFKVLSIEHKKHFEIGGEVNKEDQHFKSNWAFDLLPIGDDATYLIVRAGMKMSPEWKEWLMGTLFYPVAHGIMESVQLKTIRKYAERDANNRIFRSHNGEIIIDNRKSL
jgi:hypothetical protein